MIYKTLLPLESSLSIRGKKLAHVTEVRETEYKYKKINHFIFRAKALDFAPGSSQSCFIFNCFLSHVIRELLEYTSKHWKGHKNFILKRSPAQSKYIDDNLTFVI